MLNQSNSTLEKTTKIALLIDADNVQPRHLKVVMSHIASMGKLIIKRIYGNWAKVGLSSWSQTIADNGLVAVQIFDHIVGKNCSDIAIVIDAIELQYTKNIDIFVLVTSDSDFTGLANRLVENDKIVIGFGEAKTPKSLINSCTEFQFLIPNNIYKDTKPVQPQAYITPLTKPTIQAKRYRYQEYNKKPLNPNHNKELINFINKVIDEKADEKGILNTAVLGNELKKHATIDIGKYGYAKISELLKELNDFDVFYDKQTALMIRKRKNFDTTNQSSIELSEMNALDITALTNAISNAIIDAKEKNGDGWVGINKISRYLQDNHGLFNNVNYQVLRNLIKKIPIFSIKTEGSYSYIKDNRMDTDQSDYQNIEEHTENERYQCTDLRSDEGLLNATVKAVAHCEVNGWACVTDISDELNLLGYSAKDYNYNSLTELLKAINILDYKITDNTAYFNNPMAQKTIVESKTEEPINTNTHEEAEKIEVEIEVEIEEAEIDHIPCPDTEIEYEENLTINNNEINENNNNDKDTSTKDVSLELVELFQHVDIDDDDEEEIDISVFIIEAINNNQDKQGWASIGDIGTYMRQEIGIKISEYGYRNFGELIDECADFEIKKERRKVFARQSFVNNSKENSTEI